MFGDLKNIEQCGNRHTRLSIDEIKCAVVSSAKSELGQNPVCIAYKITIGEEQKFDIVYAWNFRNRDWRRDMVGFFIHWVHYCTYGNLCQHY